MAMDVDPKVRETTGDAGEPTTALVNLTESDLESSTDVFKTSIAVVETPTDVETDRLLDLTMDNDIKQEPSVIVTPDAVGLVDLTTKTDVRPSLVDGTQVSLGWRHRDYLDADLTDDEQKTETNKERSKKEERQRRY
jgi:hypothetical protein